MNPSQASLERAQALRQRTRTRNLQRPTEREQTPFPIVLRGYDRAAVDEYVERLTKMLSELQSARSPQGAVREALDRVGEETSAILQQAHESAAQITAAARAEARDRVEAAKRDAQSLRAEAERQASGLASDSDAAWEQRATMLDDMRRLADSILEIADSAGERMTHSPAEAVRSAIETAQAAFEHSEADTSDDEPAVEATQPGGDGQRGRGLSTPDPIPDEEPRIWRRPQPSEAIDEPSAEGEDDEELVDEEPADDRHVPRPFGRGPYCS